MNPEIIDKAISAVKRMTSKNTTMKCAYFDEENCMCINGAIAKKLGLSTLIVLPISKKRLMNMKMEEFYELFSEEVRRDLTGFHEDYRNGRINLATMKKQAVQYLEKQRSL